MGVPPEFEEFFILHEGVVRNEVMVNTPRPTGKEHAGVRSNPCPLAPRTQERNITENGWIGFTEHFWMSVFGTGSRALRSSLLRNITPRKR